MPSLTSSGLVAALVAALVVSYFLRSRSDDSDVRSVTFPPSLQDAAAFITIDYAKERTPVVIKETFAAKWDAISKWTPEYVANVGKDKLFEAKVNKERLFRYFNSEKPFAYEITEDSFNALSIPKPKPLTIAEFWRQSLLPASSSKPSTEQFVYLSTKIDNIPALIDDVESVDMLRVSEGGGGYQIHVWMGSDLVTAQTHFDESHNFFVQVFGKKTFYLSPPSEHWKLCVSPHLHPLQRESQLIFNTTSRTHNPNPKCPNQGAIHTQKVTLGPGQILYVPPYWFHSVVSEEESISVNVWSESSEGDQRITMEYMPLPFEEEWTSDEKSVALKVYLCDLIRRAKALFSGDGFAQDFLDKVVASRFQPSLGSPDAERTAHLQKLFAHITPENEAKMKEVFAKKNYAHELLTKLAAIPNVSIREQALEAYLETATQLLLGAELAYPFISLLDC